MDKVQIRFIRGKAKSTTRVSRREVFNHMVERATNSNGRAKIKIQLLINGKISLSVTWQVTWIVRESLERIFRK